MIRVVTQHTPRTLDLSVWVLDENVVHTAIWRPDAGDWELTPEGVSHGDDLRSLGKPSLILSPGIIGALHLDLVDRGWTPPGRNR